MKIYSNNLFLNNHFILNKQNKNIKSKKLENNTLVNFTSRMSAKELIQVIGENNFPNQTIFEKTKQCADNNIEFDLYEIHHDYYKKLLECETLEQAKLFYPEFKDVIDAKDLDETQLSKTLKNIKKGKSDFSFENLSLELLKKYYGQAIGLRNREGYNNISYNAIALITERLNIPRLAPTYTNMIAISTPERKKKQQDSCNQFYANNPEVRKKMSQKKKNYYKKHPEWRKEQSERMEKFYDTHPQRTKLYSQAAKEVAGEHMKKIAKDFPGISALLQIKASGGILTSAQEKYLKTYFLKCHEKYPNMYLDVSIRLKELLAEHGEI